VSTRKKGGAGTGMVLMAPAYRNEIALSVHAAVTTLEHAPGSAAATEVSRHLAVMSAAIDHMLSRVRIPDRKDAPSRAIIAALAVCEAVDARGDAGEGWALLPAEVPVLRAFAARVDEALRGIPLPVYEAARLFVDAALRPPAPLLEAA
jgi:hypothetical protein